MRTRIGLAAALLLVVAPAALAQSAGIQIPQQRMPPRDPAAEAKGTASIKGRVVSAEGARALRRSQIRLTAPELSEPRTTSTNLQGAYEFRDLPAGRYTLTVTRSGYLSLQYGQTRPGEAGKPLQLADGQAIERVDFALPRAGVIGGRITDELGEPFAGVTVWPMQPQFFRGRRRLVPVGASARTDDTGQYRLLALQPGDYIVMATIRETWIADGETKEVLGYAPSYFPGAASPTDAQRVRVAIGQEVGGIDFSLLTGRAASISGTATTSDGTPLGGASISITQETAGPNMVMMMSVGGTKVAPDGSWRVRDVPPGEYMLEVRSVDRDRPTEAAATTVVVQGVDIDGLALVTDAGGTLAGQVVTDDGSPLPESITRLRVGDQTVLADRRSRPVLAADNNGRLGADGAFSLAGVSGPSIIRIVGLPRGWAIKSIDIDGRDYVETPVDVRGTQRLDGVRIVVTNRFPHLTGRIVDDRGNPADGTVLLFPADSSKWLEATGAARSARPDQSGLYRFEAVRPGEYLIAALEYVEQWQVLDPEFLEDLRGQATRVDLDEGQAASINLKLTKPGGAR